MTMAQVITPAKLVLQKGAFIQQSPTSSWAALEEAMCVWQALYLRADVPSGRGAHGPLAMDPVHLPKWALPAT